MTKYLSKEDQYVPWSVAASKLTSLKRTLMFTDAFVNYNIYSRALIEPIYKSLGWAVDVDGDHLQKYAIHIRNVEKFYMFSLLSPVAYA